MRAFKTEGIIIKRRDFNDADRILTVITKDHGKIQVKATGVRKITSRRSSHVELLNHSILSLYKGRSLPLLTEVQTTESFASIKNDLTKVGYAYHLCEVVDGLCPDDQENRKVFFLLRNMLTQLAQHVDTLSMPIKEEKVRNYRFPDIQDYTLGTYGIGLHDEAPRPHVQAENNMALAMHEFEIELLSVLGFWDRADVLSKNFDTHEYIENILERKLKSKKFFSKMQ